METVNQIKSLLSHAAEEYAQVNETMKQQRVRRGRLVESLLQASERLVKLYGGADAEAQRLHRQLYKGEPSDYVTREKYTEVCRENIELGNKLAAVEEKLKLLSGVAAIHAPLESMTLDLLREHRLSLMHRYLAAGHVIQVKRKAAALAEREAETAAKAKAKSTCKTALCGHTPTHTINYIDGNKDYTCSFDVPHPRHWAYLKIESVNAGVEN